MKKLSLLFLLSLFILFIHAQQFEFSHLDNSNGLSNNQVECIFKDSRGFLWFGTNMGLNRYDGINFKTYKHLKKDGKSPSFDKFTKIQEDINGNLWLRSSAYIIYDWKSETFINNIDSVLNKIGLPPTPDIIEIDKNKNLYITYSGIGIYKYETASHKSTLYKHSDDTNHLHSSEISDIKVKDGYVWILHKDGVLERLNTQSGKIDIHNTFFKENNLNATIVKSLFIDSDNDVWLYPGIADRGTAYFNSQKGQWTLFDSDKEMTLSSSFIRCVGQDNTGLIWIGTDHGGINIFNKKNKNITILKNDIYNNASLAQNSAISIYCEDDGTIWVGTYKNGVSYYHPNLFKFKKSPLFHIFQRNAEIFDCNRLYKDSKNNLWIGTNGQGLIKYNAETNNIQRFFNNPKDPASISADIITAIEEDSKQTLWIGTFFGGLNSYDGRSFKRYQIDENNPNSLSSKSVYGLAEDKDNNLWIATLGGGIDRLNPERNTFTHHNANNSKLRTNYVVSTFADSLKNIYFGTDIGIYHLNNNKEITPYFTEQLLSDSLTTESVNYLMTDSRGLLWVATEKGINVYNPSTNKFTYVTTANGLPSDEVVSLIEDNDRNIWAGTRNGLAFIHCNYANNDLEYTISVFDVNDGLPSSVFNQNAIYKDKEGIIYIGGIGGYVAFDPKEIVFNQNPPKPRFTDLLITNQVIEPNAEYNGRVIIERSISDLDEIVLHHGETNFTVQFSALNFIHPEKSKYRYMLEGLDNKWTETNNGIGAASYSNLNAGTYKLIVYASNDDNVWTSEPITLKIIVQPPFWLSWWAYIIYIITFAALIRLFIKYKLNKQKEEYEQAQKIMEAQKVHEVDELKFKFFTNISHEFKTPLTLILTPLEKLMKAPASEEQKSTMNIMHKNAMNLLNMVNEILDFRKFDLNKMALNISRGNIIEFAKDICQSFSSLAAEKSIKLTFTTYLQELQMEFDREKMNKVISNLISNAFKYTEDGQIDVSIAITELLQGDSPARQLCLKVSDTGIGIEKEYLEKIFERFFRIEKTEKNTQSGTGVGLHLASEYIKLHGGEILVDSTVGKGSTFTVLLPILNSTYKELSSQDIIHSGDSSANEVAKPDIKSAQRANLPLLLIVDDNEDFCEFITSLFIEDYRVVTANDGEEGYTIVLDQLPDIILCDVMMPKMDGYEFCRQVKGDIRTSHIPIILLTAKSSEENKYSGIEAGADDYIPKPFNIDMLKLKIAKIIEKQKMLQSNFKKKIDISPSEIEITSMDEKFVQKAVSIVEENIGNPDFLVEDLCKEMGMSRVYFYKKVLALTDKTPSEFIRFIRLKRAADLLEKSQMFVNEIAFQVGFNDPKYFRKYFKEEFGVTPNEYKKNVSK
ncbi:hybrid sensor histidine kinase/response regulator [Dysgonomonas sp. 521]|uniref:hybrid sensor histidine kinase/response regulator transcription factor n=1 Tax=Dysgonomonas sp. 521 TaxID=2302932 RepID=UPI0013D0E985|nr:hybrid sensor histidine kinase/response regulator transcription factor [Dysgonomonas sp. 521]NDV94917.1 hybrid sensor histidine kinase/response regulator [Dysgonomonas sp. 521]